MHCLPRVAKLTSEEVQRIMGIEKALGVVLVAYERLPTFSTLSEADLKKIQSLERQIGVKLVALD